jgi:hypothetical protein
MCARDVLSVSTRMTRQETDVKQSMSLTTDMGGVIMVRADVGAWGRGP